MSADAATASPPAFARDVRSLRVFRYAVGSTIAMAIAMSVDWPLAYLIPVLSLSFLATPDPCPTLKQGVGFVGVVVVAALAGLMLSRWLLPFPFVYVPFVGLVLFRLFHAKTGGRSSLVTMWMLIAVLVIPLVAMLSPAVATLVAIVIIGSAATTVALVWVVYFFFPDPEGLHAQAAAIAPPAQEAPPPAERFRDAVTTTIVVLPVFVLFYTLQLAGSLLILVFVALLSSQPGFAQNFKAGGALILGNVIGGAIAIAFYQLLVVVPDFYFLLLLTLLTGLILGARVFSGARTAPLYGMAYSTALLIIGSTTSGNAEAGAKVYTRVLQIMVAVTYVVVAFGVIERFRRRREA